MTSLALQLKRLAVPQAQTALGLQEKDKKSLLFEKKEASKLDKETFYAIGVNGFQELQNIDPSFIQFEHGLFDDTSKSVQRAVQTKDVNHVLNQRIQAFLLRISPYFLLRPAQKSLEWLIYRFQIHEYNADDLLRCVLPYHESKIFVRIVQMLDLKEPTNKWHWLFPLQAPGVPLSKTTLINHCYKDIGFMKFVCDTVSLATQDRHSTEGALRTTFAFYTSTVVGAIEFASPLTENFIAALAPYLIEGAKSKEFVDYNAATYMIFSQLCLKSTLKETLLEPLIQCICKHMKASLCIEALSCIALVCQTQSLKSFPKKSFKHLCQVPSLVDSLQQLSQAHDITPLLSLLLTKLVHTAIGESSEGVHAYDILTDFLSKVQLSGALARMVCRLLLTQYIEIRKGVTAKKAITELGQKFAPIIQSLGSRYCESMDTAITSFMSKDREAADKSYASEFVQLSAISSKHQIIGDSETSLVLSLNHALSTQRVMAVGHLRQTIETGDEVDVAFFKQSLLERLHDENIAVVSEVLKFEEKLCDIIPPTELMEPLQAIMLRWRSKTKKSWVDVGRQVLTIITSSRVWSGSESTIKHRCTALLLPHLFLASGDSLAVDKQTVQVILQAALVSKHPLLQKLPTVYAKLSSRPSERHLGDKTKALMELLASNLGKMEATNQHQMVDVLLEYCHKKQARMAAYRALVATLLTRALSYVKDVSRQLGMAQQLLGLLDEDLKKMSDPEFKLSEGQDVASNPLQMDHIHDALPAQYHAHLTRLLTSKRKMLKMGAVSLDISQVEILFWCLENVIVAVKIPKGMKKEDKRWWTVSKNSKQEVEGHYLTWLLSIVDLLTHGAADSCLKKDPESFRNLIKTVLEQHLSSPQVLFRFFALVWTSHCQQVGDVAHKVTPLFQARLLHMGCVSIKVMAESEVEMLLDEKSPVMPALVLALSSQLYPIRQAAISCLRALHSGAEEDNSSSPYWYLVKSLIGSGQELVNDVEHLPVVMGSFFAKVSTDHLDVDAAPSRRTLSSQCLAQLLQCITGEHTATFVKQTLLGVLSEVDNKIVLTSLLGMLSDLLLEAANPDDLSHDKMKLIHHIIGHFTPKTTECLENQAQSLELYLLLQALSTEGACHGLASPQDRMLKQMTPVLYASIASPKVRQTILAKLIDLQVDTKSPQVAGRIGKVLKKLMLDAQQLVHEMNALEPESTKSKSLKDAKKARLRSKTAESDAELLPSDGRPWQRITHILEHLQSRKMKRIHNVHLLVPAMFNILAKCMEPGQSGEMEYIKHLVFTSLLTLCNKLSPDNQPISRDILNESHFNVELIVKCIRTTDDPQTHNHALLLLATAAGIFPEHVLHSTMTIFTFMGASVLRKDDSYSFQVITKTIDSVIPALIKASEEQNLPEELSGGGATDIITMVMRVFVDALPHTPEHRRLPIFSQLMTTIGGKRHLWRMLALLIAGYATKGEAVIHPGEQIDSKGAARSMEFWLVLCEQFEPGVRVSNLIKLLKYISTLPEEKDEASTARPVHRGKKTAARDTPKVMGALFDVGSHSDRHLRQFKFAAISFLPQVLSSQDFVEQMIYLSSDQVNQLNEQFQSLLEETLCYITQVAHGVQHNANKPTAKFWKALLHRTYEVLDKVNALLPAETFIQVVSGLMDNHLPTVRRKAMELLNNKLMSQMDYFSDEQIPLLLNLRGVLCSIATCNKSPIASVATTPSKRRKSAVATAVATSANREEVDINRQTALYSLKLMCKVIGHLYPKEFKEVLDISVTTLKEDGLNPQIAASAMLCLAETVSSLQAHAISYLPGCMSVLLSVLANKHNIASSDLHLLSAITSVQKIVETLPNFLSPYLLRLLLQVTRFSCNGEDERSQLNLRLKAIRHKLATTVPTRVLLPAIAQGYEEATEKHKDSIGPLMSVIGEHLGALDKDDLNSQHTQLVNFYLMALDYRGKHSEMPLEEVGKIEGHVINSLVTMVMKLSESSFRPMFLKICDWASRGSTNKDRLLTLYRLSDSIADNLKGLFCLFAGHIVPQCAELLNANNTANTEESYFGDDTQSTEKSCGLLRYILDCLFKCFLHDKSGFATKERFDCLLQPLADQIENMQGSESDCEERIIGHLTPCMAQLLVASHDSASWQPLNYQVLLKTRHSSAQVRIGALTVLEALHSKLAEDYLSLLPETIPFLAELMEDESEEVEEKCQEIVSQLEKTLGEPLQKYF